MLCLRNYALGCLIGALLLKFVYCFLVIKAAFGKWLYFGRLRRPEALRHLSGVETPEALFTDLCIKQTNLTLLSHSTVQPFYPSTWERDLFCA